MKPKDRIVAEAIRLFAEQGYHATSVGQIQQAAGLTHGSGALYKHFSSKEDLLSAAIERHINEYQHAKQAMVPALPADPLAALEVVARGMLASLSENAALIRVSFGDLGRFDGLAERVVDGLLRPLYRDVAELLSRWQQQGRLVRHDSQAVSAVLLSALSYHSVLRLCLGAAPGDVDGERFIAGWLQLAGALITECEQE